MESSSNMVAMQIEQGMRFELRLRSMQDGAAHYDVTLQQPEQTLLGSAEIAPDGAVRLQFAEAVVPDWCNTQLRAALRGLYREAQGRGLYPRRWTRWRPKPGSGSPGSEG